MKNRPWSAVWRAKENGMKYWEIIADNLSKAGWSSGLRFRRGFSLASFRRHDVAAAAATSVRDQPRFIYQGGIQVRRRSGFRCASIRSLVYLTPGRAMRPLDFCLNLE
jgi:hypothetical protein